MDLWTDGWMDGLQLQQGESVWMVKNDGMTSVRGWAHSKLSGFLLWHTH